MPLKPNPAAHLAMSSNLLKGFWSAANWARKIAGPLTVFIVDTHSFHRDSLGQADPAGAAFGHGSLDEGHAAHSLANARHQVAQLRRRIAEPCANRVGEVAIDISKCFYQTLRMPHGQPEVGARRGRQVVPGRMQGLTRLPYPVQMQVIGILLPPVESALFAVEMKLQIVAIAGGDLGDKQHSRRPVVELKQNVAVIVQLPAGDYRGKVGANLHYLAAAHVLEQVECVHTDVANGSAQARLRRVRSPHSLFVTGGFERTA